MVPVSNAKRQSTTATQALAVIILAISVTGCKSSSPSQYISPRITGRVLDAKTQQPIAGVQVRRLVPNQAPDVAQMIKGGERLDQSPVVRTGRDGEFVLVSEKNLALFQRLGWYSVNVAFVHSGYERLTTEYTLLNATNTPTGEPLVKAGDIRLQPKPN
jgi:hypothetical protein